MLMVNQLTGFGVGAANPSGPTDPDWAFVQAMYQPTAEDVAANAYPTDETGRTITWGAGAQLTAAAAVAGGGGIAYDAGEYTDLPGVTLTAATPFVVEAFITLPSIGSAAYIFAKWGASTGYQFYINTGGQARTYFNGGGGFASSTTLAVNAVHHIVWSNDGTTLRSFVNGALDGSAPMPVLTDSAGIATSRSGARDNQGGASGPMTLHALRVTVGSHRGYTGASIPVPTALWPTS